MFRKSKSYTIEITLSHKLYEETKVKEKSKQNRTEHKIIVRNTNTIHKIRRSHLFGKRKRIHTVHLNTYIISKHFVGHTLFLRGIICIVFVVVATTDFTHSFTYKSPFCYFVFCCFFFIVLLLFNIF